MRADVTINVVVEGPLDEAVARRLVREIGATPGRVFGKKGKEHIRQKLGAYNKAAGYEPWFVLVDLDRDATCAPALRGKWIPQPAPLLCFRVAVHSVEAWLMGDAEALGKFLGIRRRLVPGNPELLPNPKADMVKLIAMSPRRSLREDMLPRTGSGRAVGPAYTSRMSEFVEGHWRPSVAARNVVSLQRAIQCLCRLARGGR